MACVFPHPQFELNGGGFAGNYSVLSGGDVTVEKDGDAIEPEGSIAGSDNKPYMSLLLLQSDTGDIDLTLLPSSI